jgi:hypothetical protein
MVHQRFAWLADQNNIRFVRGTIVDSVVVAIVPYPAHLLPTHVTRYGFILFRPRHNITSNLTGRLSPIRAHIGFEQKTTIEKVDWLLAS